MLGLGFKRGKRSQRVHCMQVTQADLKKDLTQVLELLKGMQQQ